MPVSSSGSFTLSSTVRQSKSTGAWKTMPYSRPRRASCDVLPLTLTLPEVGAVRSPIRRSRVLLPHPDGPMRLTNSPPRMTRSIPSRAVVRPSPPRVANVFVTPSTWTTVSPV